MSAPNVAISGQAVPSKPPYKVPSMVEINAIPYNGLNVISTFSGCGGSCLGYRMAGFKVLWANEFIDIARKTYQLNFPETFVDSRDIRIIQPQEILEKIGKEKGEIDLLDGSPPCSSFSISGIREKGWGEKKLYSEGIKQRTDDLFLEYIRILEGLQPKVFVAENVEGLIKGKSKGHFLEFLKLFKERGYNVKAKVLKAEWLGVPQARHRLFFVGVRNDLQKPPAFPKPEPFFYSLQEAIRDLPFQIDKRQKLSPRMVKWYKYSKRGQSLEVGCDKVEGKKQGFSKVRLSWKKPSPTITASAKGVSGTIDQYHPDFPVSLSIPELKRVCSFPDDFQLIGDFRQQWERLGRAVPPLMMKAIAETIRDEVFDG